MENTLPVSADKAHAVRQRLEQDRQTRSHVVALGHGRHEYVASHVDSRTHDTIVDTWSPGHHLISQSRLHEKEDGSIDKHWRDTRGHKSFLHVGQSLIRIDQEGGGVSQTHMVHDDGSHTITEDHWGPHGEESISKVFTPQHRLQAIVFDRATGEQSEVREVRQTPHGQVVHNKVRRGHQVNESILEGHGQVRQYMLGPDRWDGSANGPVKAGGPPASWSGDWLLFG